MSTRPTICQDHQSCWSICWRGPSGPEMTCEEANSPACMRPEFIQGHRTPFHDKALEEATQKLRDIIDAIPPSQGRSLAFIIRKRGLRLVWMSDGPPALDAVRVTDEAEIARDFLGIDD